MVMYSGLRIGGEVRELLLVDCGMKRGWHLFSQISRDLDATDMQAYSVQHFRRGRSVYFIARVSAKKGQPNADCREFTDGTVV